MKIYKETIEESDQEEVSEKIEISELESQSLKGVKIVVAED
jgi:hypothetical protein